MSYIWIDTTSGTWGLTEDSNGALVLIDPDVAAPLLDDKNDSDAASVYAALESMSDSEVAEFGLQNGQPAVPGVRTKIVYVNVNEEGEDYDTHDTVEAALAVQDEFPNDTIEVRVVTA